MRYSVAKRTIESYPQFDTDCFAWDARGGTTKTVAEVVLFFREKPWKRWTALHICDTLPALRFRLRRMFPKTKVLRGYGLKQGGRL